MKILVIGYGKSGQAAVAFLKKQKKQILIYDGKIEGSGIINSLDLDLLQEIDEIILSPGFDPRISFIEEARKRGIPILGETELGLRYVKNPVVAITGTNGKTTTVMVAEYLLKKNGIKAKALGNIGQPLTDYLLAPDPSEVLILELSSFQIETMQTKAIDLAFVLNITPNHLDRYGSFEEYRDVKLSLKRCLKNKAQFFVSKEVASSFSLKENIFDEEADEGTIFSQNSCAAKYIAKYFGAEDLSIKGFHPPKHRLELIRELRGVKFYNDSKATSVFAVIKAVERLENSIYLICGGVHKGFPYTSWIAPFKNRVKKIYAIGKSAEKIHKELESDFDVLRANSLEDAILAAFINAQSGDKILLSPGCSSFDQFKNYEERGDRFIQIVNSLTSQEEMHDAT